MKRVAFIAVALVAAVAMSLATSAPAKADVIDFNIASAGGTWSFAGSGAFTLTGAAGVTVTYCDVTVGCAGTTHTTTGQLAITTGNFTGSNAGTLNFAGNASSTAFSISGLFSGSITSATISNISGVTALEGNLVIGNVSSTVLSALGLVGGNPYSGTGSVNLVITSGTLAGGSASSGTAVSSDTTLSPTPEPGSLILFGSGLVGLAGMIRRKLKA